METLQKPDPRLKEDPNKTARKKFILKFKSEEDMESVMRLLRRNGGLTQRVIDNEILTFVDKNTVIALRKHKELQDKYEVW